MTAPDPFWWHRQAACRGADTADFFPPEGERGPERAAREIRAKDACGRCPVREDCFSYAISRPEKYGTWAGMNEEELKAERRRQSRRHLTAQRREQVAS